jgi:hypothetical protein
MRRGNRSIVCGAVLLVAAAATGMHPAAAGAATAPSAPTITYLHGGPDVGQMTIKWSVPLADGGAAITAYELQFAVDGGAWSPSSGVYGASVRKAVVPCPAPLTPGHGCSFRVRASNGIAGAWSKTKSAVWAKPSASPLNTAVAGPDVGQAKLTFTAPSSNGGLAVTSYRYQVDAGAGFGAWITVAPGNITTLTTTPRPQYRATVSCAITTLGTTAGCRYRVDAVNAVAGGPASTARTAPLSAPSKAQNLAVATTSVVLGTGGASQLISWNAPASNGGLAITHTTLLVCNTSQGSLCKDYSPPEDWSIVADYPGSPSSGLTANACPANGRCAYEVKAVNAKGASFVVASSRPAPPTSLIATPSTTVAGRVDLTWAGTGDLGTAFGHYVLFECSVADDCSAGSWTSNPGDAAPWASSDLGGTATTTSFACGITTPCEFRIGYVDSAGNIGGVTNVVTAVGLDAPGLSAVASGSPGEIDLSWTAPSTAATITSYKIERDTGTGFTPLVVVSAGTTTYIDTTCGPGATCGYRVMAFYTVGTSAVSTAEYATAAP